VNAQLSAYLFQEEIYHFHTDVVVIIPEPWASYSAEEYRLLNKILTSVKLDIHSVTVVVQPSFDLQALKAYAPAKVLIFGSSTTDSIAFYEKIAAQGFTVIRADDLRALDDQKKKNLWLALRQMFDV
jgi:hypothetical protein